MAQRRADPSAGQEKNELPAPENPVQQTKLWLAASHPKLFSHGERIMMHNLETVSSQVTKLTEMVARLCDEMQHQKFSRRSSLSSIEGSASRRSSTSDAPAAQEVEEDLNTTDISLEAFKQLVDKEVELFYQLFGSFILREKKTPLVSRTKNIASFSKLYIEFAQNELPSFAEEDRVVDLITKLTALNQEHKVDLYIQLSRRYKAEKSGGKKTVKTVVDGFQTDINRESVSTEATPRRPRTRTTSKQGPVPTTPSARRGHNTRTIPDSEEPEEGNTNLSD